MKRIIIFLLITLLLAACNNANNQNSIFKDKNLERAVRESLNYSDDHRIQLEDLDSITYICCYRCKDLSGLRYLRNLKTVVITFSRIIDFSELYKLKKLNELFIYHCKISDIRFLSRLNNIEFLDLDHNRIEDLTPIGSLNQLKELSLDHNNIKDISVLSKLTNLESISVMDNSIEQLPDFSNCKNLRKLYLDDNSFICNNNFYNLKQVQVIWLGTNKIDKIDWVTSLDSIKYVNVCDNPINCNVLDKNIEIRNLKENGFLQLDPPPIKRSLWVSLDLLIVTLFIIFSLLGIYLFICNKHVEEIIEKDGKRLNLKILTFKKITILHNIYKNSNSINIHDRKVIKKYFLVSIFALIISITFIYVIFFSNW